MKVAIVILNWNGKELLKQFLPTVVQYTPFADIYVADNASTDDSVDFIRSEFPEVKLIVNSVNGGYSKGYNDALTNVEADIYCLLNNDIGVSENWLDPILDTFANNANIGIIQPKILDFKRKNYFEYAGAGGGLIDKYGYPFCRGRIFETIEEDYGQYNDTAPIFWASGACLFIRSTIFKELDGFDESFFAHMEEIDLCWRGKNKGYEVVYVGASKVYHVGGATLSNTSPKKTFLNFRNSLFVLVKNGKGNMVPVIITRLIFDGLAGLRFLLQFKFGHFTAIIKAHFSFYAGLPRVLRQRKTEKNKISYYEIKSIVWEYFVNKKKYYKSL